MDIMVFPLDSTLIQMIFMISSFHSFRESQHGSHRFNTFISRSNNGVSSQYFDGDDQAVSFRLLSALLAGYSMSGGIRNRFVFFVPMLSILQKSLISMTCCIALFDSRSSRAVQMIDYINSSSTTTICGPFVAMLRNAVWLETLNGMQSG